MAAISLMYLGLTSPAAPPAEGAEGKAEDLKALDGLLLRGEWEAARMASTEWIQKDRQTLFAPYLARWVARLALAEAGLDRFEDAVWHWQVALNLDRAVLTSEMLAAFGKPGELLAAQRLRTVDEEPVGLSVPQSQSPDGMVRPARKLEGELAQLSKDVTLVPAPKNLKVQVIIDTNGKLRYPVVVSGGPPGAVWELLEGLRGWRYEPAQQGDRAVASFRDLTINPPTGKPLSELVVAWEKAAEVESLLRRHEWDAADRRSRRLWLEEISKLPTRERLAVVLTLRALAQAGAGETAAGICRWQAAQHLDDGLYHADLAPYGAAGALLDKNRWGTARVESTTPKVRRPEVLERTLFPAPAATKRVVLEGTVVLAAIVNEQGALRQPVIVRLVSKNRVEYDGFEPAGTLDYSSEALDLRRLMAVSALDSFCDWKLKPAAANGRPVAYQETVAMPFASVSPGGPLVVR